MKREELLSCKYHFKYTGSLASQIPLEIGQIAIRDADSIYTC